jgi:hypothetical protein
VLSYDQDRLLAPNKKNQLESALKLHQPLRLDSLGLMLGIIRVEFADYKLTKVSSAHFQQAGCHVLRLKHVLQENCWAMSSVILESLESQGRGTYVHGKLCFPEWAPEVRERVRNGFVSVLRASALNLLKMIVLTGRTTAVDRRPAYPESSAASQVKIDHLASCVEQLS